MNNTITTIGPFSQILTMDGMALRGALQDMELPIISNAGIAVQDGHIVSIAPWSEIRSLSSNMIEILSPVVAMPGWIDAHTHLCFAGKRADEYALRLSGYTYQQIAAQGGGILATVKQTREASINQLKQGIVQRTTSLLAKGITTCEVKSGYGLTIKDEFKMLKAIKEASEDQPVELVPTCLAAHYRPPEFASNAEYLQFLSEALLPELKKFDIVKRIDIFVDEGAFSAEEAQLYLYTAKEMGFSICVHADQFSCGGGLLAAEVGALSADHLELISSKDARILSHAQVHAIVLPGASLGLGLPFAPARMLLDEHLSLIIASDWNPGSAPMGNLLMQASAIAVAEHLTTAETFAAVTYRAARALELHDRGILRPSMRADFILFPSSDYRDILYYQGEMTPSHVFIKGKKVFEI